MQGLSELVDSESQRQEDAGKAEQEIERQEVDGKEDGEAQKGGESDLVEEKETPRGKLLQDLVPSPSLRSAIRIYDFEQE